MDLKRLQFYISNHIGQQEQIREGKRYYANKTDILNEGIVPKENKDDPLRNADNRINHNFHQVLVDEKTSYLFTYPVMINLGDDTLEEKVNDILGDEWNKTLKELCVEASNTGVAWLHYWIESEDNKNVFNYACMNTEEIIPIYSEGIKKELEQLIRYYNVQELTEQNTFINYAIIEYWNKEEYIYYKLKDSFNSNNVVEKIEFAHSFKQVPYIEFDNNTLKQGDLNKYKKLIDLYDRVTSGFANDLEDIQQIIYILQGYGGEDPEEFMRDIKRFKMIKAEAEGGAVSTLQIDIPVEARKVLLEQLKKQIFESGQGLQQDIESVGNASGVTLKFFYRKLELKAGLLETEFRTAINKLIRVILDTMFNIQEQVKIVQTWTRNAIQNDLENTQIAQQSYGILPLEIILRNHPWVEDIEEAKELIKQQEQEQMFDNDYANLGAIPNEE